MQLAEWRGTMWIRSFAAAIAIAGCSAATGDKNPDPEPPACESATGPTGSLVLDGKDDYATMGATPALGLERFTLEAWVRRDGDGATATTGAGGLVAGPDRGEGPR